MCGCGAIKNNSKGTTSTSTKLCQDPSYTDLRTLDLKVLEMLQGGYKAADMLEANTILNGWIQTLKSGCPPDSEYQTLKQFITDEYTIFNP